MVLNGQKQKKKTFFIPEDTKLTSKLFFGSLHWDIFFVLLHLCKYILVQYTDGKRYLVNKNTSFVSAGIGVLWLPENKKKSLNLKFYMITRSFGQIP